MSSILLDIFLQNNYKLKEYIKKDTHPIGKNSFIGRTIL